MINKVVSDIKELKNEISRPVRLMEVCGTHTVAIFRHGIRDLLPEGIQLLSGPGCPVCVTPPGEVEEILALAGAGVTVAAFGDVMKVPGTRGCVLGLTPFMGVRSNEYDKRGIGGDACCIPDAC